MGFIKDVIIRKRKEQTVFNVSELAQLVEGYQGEKLYSALKFANKTGDIKRITRGFYALTSDYSLWELGNKLRIPSYVSLYTVLQKSGVVFQPYTSIFLMAKRSEILEVDGQKYIYRKIKDEILLNSLGISNVDQVAVASIERALCDKLYLDGEEFFDNLRSVNWELMTQLNQEIYENNEVITQFIRKNRT